MNEMSKVKKKIEAKEMSFQKFFIIFLQKIFCRV